MAECAEELRSKIPTDNECPADEERVFFIGPTTYVGRTWPKVMECILAEVRGSLLPADDDIEIDDDWALRNYYELPLLNNRRFRLYMDGIRLNKWQWRPLTGGGWELLGGLVQELGQIFSYEIY